MDPDFWRARWAKNEIGFHQAEVNPYLLRHLHRLGLPAGSPVLVPLCGKSRDLAHLAALGHRVLGVELVEDAVRAFFAERGLEPERTEDGALVRYEAGGVTLWAGDCFALEPERLGPVAGVFDRAALIALPPPTRARYLAQLARLAPRAPRLLVTIEYDAAKREGPPFSVPADEVRASLPGAEVLESRDILAEMPRFAEAGVDRLIETAWLVRP